MNGMGIIHLLIVTFTFLSRAPSDIGDMQDAYEHSPTVYASVILHFFAGVLGLYGAATLTGFAPLATIAQLEVISTFYTTLIIATIFDVAAFLIARRAAKPA